MTELFIFSIGIVLGCTLSYIFLKTGIKSNYDAFNFMHGIDIPDGLKVADNDEYEPEKDTTATEPQLDWDGYPYTEEYEAVNKDDNQGEIIGFIDPENDEPN